VQGGLCEPNSARRVAGGCGLIGLANEHIGHQERVAGLLGPFHGPVGPVRGCPSVAAVLVEPADEFGIAGAHLQQADALRADGASKQLLNEVKVAADGSQET
jgi:hypothetical protein